MSALRFQNYFVVVLVIWRGYSHVISVGSELKQAAFCDLQNMIRYDDYCENVLWVILIFITVMVLRYGGKDGLKLTGFKSM
jgi:hypothetical protein